MIPESVLKEIRHEALRYGIDNNQHPPLSNVDKNETQQWSVNDFSEGAKFMYERMEKQIESKDEEIKRLREAFEKYMWRVCSWDCF
jgi:hypothetical protein